MELRKKVAKHHSKEPVEEEDLKEKKNMDEKKENN